ncbi:MAG: hypothetical protein V4712_17570 [Pseudomonadota bacterium]
MLPGVARGALLATAPEIPKPRGRRHAGVFLKDDMDLWFWITFFGLICVFVLACAAMALFAVNSGVEDEDEATDFDRSAARWGHLHDQRRGE